MCTCALPVPPSLSLPSHTYSFCAHIFSRCLMCIHWLSHLPTVCHIFLSTHILLFLLSRLILLCPVGWLLVIWIWVPIWCGGTLGDLFVTPRLLIAFVVRCVTYSLYAAPCSNLSPSSGKTCHILERLLPTFYWCCGWRTFVAFVTACADGLCHDIALFPFTPRCRWLPRLPRALLLPTFALYYYNCDC